MHKSSLLKGSTARNPVVKVVSAWLLFHGIDVENAKGPGGKGQKVLSLFGEGNGDGGSNGLQK